MNTKEKVTYDVKEKGVLITKERVFPDVDSACTFVRSLRGSTVSSPLMETIEKGNRFVGRG